MFAVYLIPHRGYGSNGLHISDDNDVHDEQFGIHALRNLDAIGYQFPGAFRKANGNHYFFDRIHESMLQISDV